MLQVSFLNMKNTDNISIQQAAETAIKVVADAALQATKLVATQAAEAAKVINTQSGADHDLIIEIKTIQKTMLDELREIKTGTAQSISDHETRLGKLETANTRVVLMLSGGIFALTFLIGLIVYHIMGK
jgi:hypothetical protein